VKTTAESAERTLAETYNRTPYTGNPYCLTHPALLAAYGHLYGLSPPPATRCRVLELGCGDGGNLIPMAYELKNSEFVGIDLSSVQIAAGQQAVEALSLTNIHLKTRSIMDVNAADGRFDYIIAHGVYSWVPDAVKAQILEICRNHLAAQGLAYISYNVLPGWQFNKSMRDLMLYRTRRMEDHQECTNAAYEIVDTMISATADSNGFHDIQFRFFGKTLQQCHDLAGYLLHEYLEPDNDPFYFHQFARDLAQNGMQYICDAEQDDFELSGLPAQAVAKFQEIASDPLEVEQYLDFLINTRFRRSLICHAEARVDRKYQLEKISPLHATTDVIPILENEESTIDEATRFKKTNGRAFSTEHPYAAQVLRKLSAIRPCTMTVSSLVQRIRDAEPADPGSDSGAQAEKIGHVIQSLFFNGLLTLLGAPRICTRKISEQPTASPIARLQAPTGRITNLCHRTIVMDDDMARYILARLDGTCNRAELADHMWAGISSGKVPLHGNPPKNREDAQAQMAAQLDQILQNLARCGVLAS